MMKILVVRDGWREGKSLPLLIFIISRFPVRLGADGLIVKVLS